MDKPLRRPDTAFTSQAYQQSKPPKRKARNKDGIDKLEAFLDEYSPQKKSFNTSSFVVQLINSILKDDGAPMTSSVTEAYGNKTVRGNLGPKVVDFDKDKEKHTERKGEPDDYVLIEQNDMERRIRGYKEDEKDEGPESSMDSGAVGSGTVDVAKQFTGWDWKGQQGEYKRGTENDKIDDNPRIKKDIIKDFLLNLSKGEDGSDYVEEPYDDDIKILTRDDDSTRGTYTGNNASYNYTQTLKKADDVKDLKWTDTDKLAEKAVKRMNKPLKLIDLTLDDIDDIDLPAFDENDSKEVKNELNKVLTQHNNYKEHKDIERKLKAISQQDNDFLDSFVELTNVLDMWQKKKNKINLTKDKLKDLNKDTRTIVLRLKMKYNRPRPKDLTEYHNIKMTPEDLKTSNTPSYPSGHAFQAHLIAKVLSKKFPDYEKRFMSLANEIASNRVTAGVHFPSDSEAGILLADKVYEKLNMDKLDF